MIRKVKARDDDQAEVFETAGHSAGFDPEGHCFSVVVPNFDDWHASIEYDLGSPMPSVQFGYDCTLSFSTEDQRDQFAEWLRDALARAREGHRTMWP